MRWVRPSITKHLLKTVNTGLDIAYGVALIAVAVKLGFSFSAAVLSFTLIFLHLANPKEFCSDLRSQLVHYVLLLLNLLLLLRLQHGIEPEWAGIALLPYTASVMLNNPAYTAFPMVFLGYSLYLYLEEPSLDIYVYVLNLINFSMFPLAIFFIGLLIRQQQQILNLNQRIQSQVEVMAEMTQLRERNRLAEAMHDTIGHTLTAAIVSLEGVSLLLPKRPPDAIALLNSVREQLQAGLGDLRQTVRTLKTDTLADHATLHDSLLQLVERTRRQTAVYIELDYPVQMELLPIQEYVLYSLVREGLTNVLKHSRATHVQIRFEPLSPQCIALTLIDNGKGTDSFAPGFGLTHLQQKVLALGGTFSINTQAQAGFSIHVLLPLALDLSIKSHTETATGRIL